MGRPCWEDQVITEVTYEYKRISLERKCKKHGLTFSNWKDKVSTWSMVRVYLSTSEEFDKAFIVAENIAEHDWAWSTDYSSGYYFYFVREEDALIFKLTHENSSKQVP